MGAGSRRVRHVLGGVLRHQRQGFPRGLVQRRNQWRTVCELGMKVSQLLQHTDAMCGDVGNFVDHDVVNVAVERTIFVPQKSFGCDTLQ